MDRVIYINGDQQFAFILGYDYEKVGKWTTDNPPKHRTTTRGYMTITDAKRAGAVPAKIINHYFKGYRADPKGNDRLGYVIKAFKGALDGFSDDKGTLTIISQSETLRSLIEYLRIGNTFNGLKDVDVEPFKNDIDAIRSLFNILNKEKRFNLTRILFTPDHIIHEFHTIASNYFKYYTLEDTFETMLLVKPYWKTAKMTYPYIYGHHMVFWPARRYPMYNVKIKEVNFIGKPEAMVSHSVILKSPDMDVVEKLYADMCDLEASQNNPFTINALTLNAPMTGILLRDFKERAYTPIEERGKRLRMLNGEDIAHVITPPGLVFKTLQEMDEKAGYIQNADEVLNITSLIYDREKKVYKELPTSGKHIVHVPTQKGVDIPLIFGVDTHPIPHFKRYKDIVSVKMYIRYKERLATYVIEITTESFQIVTYSPTHSKYIRRKNQKVF